MIRGKISTIINNRLDNNGYFKYNDFKIELTPGNYGNKVKITYDYDNQYFIEITIPDEKETFRREEKSTNSIGFGVTTKIIEYMDYSIEGIMCPGNLSYKEKIKNRGIDGIGSAIVDWLDNLWSDIMAAPQNRIFKEQKDEIERIKEKVSEMPDEYFTVEEANDLKERLSKLEEQLASKLTVEETNENAEKQIKLLKKEIQTLKETLPALKKAGWFKSFTTKMMTWLADPANQKLLKAGKDLVAGMLPESKGTQE